MFSERLDAIKSNSLKLRHWKIGIKEKRILHMATPAKIRDLEFHFEVTLKKKKKMFSHKCSIILLKKYAIEKGLSVKIFIRSK